MLLLVALLYIVWSHLSEVGRRRGDFRVENMGYQAITDSQSAAEWRSSGELTPSSQNKQERSSGVYEMVNH